MEVNTRKTIKRETKKLYNELVQKDNDALEGEKTKDTIKYNILNILKDVGSIFTGLYFHYKDVPREARFERNIAER